MFMLDFLQFLNVQWSYLSYVDIGPVLGAFSRRVNRTFGKLSSHAMFFATQGLSVQDNGQLQQNAIRLRSGRVV